MQPTHPFIAISIGAVIALSPIGTASAQTTSSSDSSPVSVASGNPSETESLELAKPDPSEKANESESSDVEAIDTASQAQDESEPQEQPVAESEAEERIQPTAAEPEEESSAEPQTAQANSEDEASDAQASTDDQPDAAADASRSVSDESTPTEADSTEDAPDESNSAEVDSEDAEVNSAAEETASDATQSAQATPESLPLPSGTPTPSTNETEGTGETPATPESLPLPGDTTPAPTTETPDIPETEEVSDAAPEYLDPDPNPLSFPTQPEEVEIVGTQPITLEQAWELAQRNSPELFAARQQLDLAEAQLREARAANAPTLQVGSGITFSENQNRGQTNLLGETVGNQDNINVSLSGTVQANYDLFTAGRRSATIRASEGQVRFQELQLETVAEQLRLDVANDYYDLQEADEQVRISRAALEEAQRSLRDAEALERAGVGTRFDVLQAQVDVANSQQELTQNLSQQQISRRQLAQQLNVSQAVNVVAADPVQVAAPWTLTLEESIVLAYRNRAELEQQLVQREINDEQRQAALADLGPQISLFAEYSVSDLLNDSGSSSTSSSSNGFQDTYQFGAQLNLLLFDGGAARARADQQEANIEIAESQFIDARNQIRFEVEQAYLSLQANSENIETTTLALQQATEALRLARLRFQAGVGTQTDVLRSQTELTRSEVNQLNAILGYNRSLVQLQRAVSNLPDSRLAEAP